MTDESDLGARFITVLQVFTNEKRDGLTVVPIAIGPPLNYCIHADIFRQIRVDPIL
jgi:hypothetical protein